MPPAAPRLGPTFPRRTSRWCTTWASRGTSSSCSTCRSLFSRNESRGTVFPYFWSDQQAPRIGLLPRNGDLEGLIWFEAPACYVFHIVNAYEAEGGEVVVDVVRHPRTHEHDRHGPNEGTPALVRWTLDRVRGRLSESLLDDHGGEFPRYRRPPRRTELPLHLHGALVGRQSEFRSPLQA